MGRREPSSYENAMARRREKRAEMMAEQERAIMERFVQGMTYADIAKDLKIGYQTAWQTVNDVLERRSERDGEVAKQARAMLQMQIEAELGTWLPRSMGKVKLEDGTTSPPDPRAADITIKLREQYAKITGAFAPVRIEGEIVQRPDDPEAAVVAVLSKLAMVSGKGKVIDGHLAEVGHTQQELTGGHAADAPPPPV